MKGAISRSRSRQSLISVWWLVLSVLAITAIVVIVAQRQYIRWTDVAWYQVIAGFALTIFGGMISGWGIATFIASSKGNAPRAASYQIRPKPPPVAPTVPTKEPTPDGGGPTPSDSDKHEAPSPESLDMVSGIGPKRARAAAVVGFRTLDDVRTASPERLEELRKEIGSSLAFRSVLVQARNAAAPEELP